ncbi:LOW QUALITY PROTEIN: olfactory receptor 4K13-like [Ursus arctos]|uniref:LOW QUALITY PROTEIN: olfactory receptor 4K13-like n=1 Tax=Ursus arctos TaxID=9644 RepID=UPI002017ABD7|nr:LOW QUALITY PROTEIN: olfactory receptor 4K13-like [Ursus arctos]
MGRANHSVVSELILLGLSKSQNLHILFFLGFSVVYARIVLGSLLILVPVTFNSHLHTPMCFLLIDLSCIDMSLASFTTPKMIVDFLQKQKTISWWGCYSQMFFMHLLGGSEMMLLVAMAIDRYVAVCKPLHYTTVMSPRVLVRLLLSSYAVEFVHSSSQTAFTLNLPFCGPSVVDSFFCDLPFVIKLACKDAYLLQLLVIADSGLLSLVCFLLLLVSYMVIIYSVRHRRTASGSAKAFSTPSAHITVVTLSFVPCVFIYVWRFSQYSVNKILSVFYMIFTPLLNPIIYTLRNQEVKAAMMKIRTRHINSKHTL